MSLIVSWLVFPLILGLLALGCGLLLELVLRVRLPGALIPVVGLAVILVVGPFPIATDATAELVTPIVVALAVAGLTLSRAWTRLRQIDGWALAVAVAAFLIYGSPVLLSGDATFTGFIKLDDTSTWLAMTDYVMEHGRVVEGLAPSTYEATIAANVGSGYPIGVFIPLGIGGVLTGQDIAWLIQPYLAVTAALLALVLYRLARSVPGQPSWLAALVAVLAGQAALLLGYTLWGGIKEIATAMLVALVAALVPGAVRGDARKMVVLAVASMALVNVLSTGGGVWLALPILVGLVAAGRMDGLRVVVRRAAVFALAGVICAIPIIATGDVLPFGGNVQTLPEELGNLFEPLNPVQVLGIWPAGDFRIPPDQEVAAYVLVAVVVAAQAGLGLLFGARPWALLLYVGATPLACLGIALAGSPWIDAKAMAVAAPALLLAGLVGAVAVTRTRWRPLGIAALAIMAGGVLWSSALAYQDVTIAPRAQLEELEKIGPTIAGHGPTLMTEYMPYGARHFLRDADPESASEFRRRLVPLVGGGSLGKGQFADTDGFRMTGLLIYRTLVLRRSPTQSRPPSPYRLTWTGRYYEVWQRPVGSEASVIEHLPLGDLVDQTARPKCSDVMRLARRAGKGGLAAVSRPRPAVLQLPAADSYPEAWEPKKEPYAGYALLSSPGQLQAQGPGTLKSMVRITRVGRFRIWLGGSVRGVMKAAVDGAEVGEARHHLNNYGGWIPLGAADLARGEHEISLSYGGRDLHPGSGSSRPPGIGPLALSTGRADPGVKKIPASRARELCGKRWDWIEALA
jgi:hypothetical protein